MAEAIALRNLTKRFSGVTILEGSQGSVDVDKVTHILLYIWVKNVGRNGREEKESSRETM